MRRTSSPHSRTRSVQIPYQRRYLRKQAFCAEIFLQLFKGNPPNHDDAGPYFDPRFGLSITYVTLLNIMLPNRPIVSPLLQGSSYGFSRHRPGVNSG